MLPGTVRYLVTHVRPHWDEIVAIWLLVRFGNRQFPDINKAVDVFWDGGPQVEVLGVARPLAEIRPFSLFVGTGGGPLDEHIAEGRLEDSCAATLTAKFLGIQNNPALRQILSYTLNNDTKGGAGAFELPIVLRTKGLPAKEAFRLGFVVLDTFFQEQKHFHEVVVPFFKKNSRVAIARDKFLVLAISGEDEALAKAARYCSPNHVMLIQVTSRGANIFVNSKSEHRISLAGLVQEIRKAEAFKAGRPFPPKEKIAREGKIPECPEWYFHCLNGGLGGALLNDPASHRGASPPTRLSEADIVRCIKADFRL